jgi:hypothetical protein
MRVQSSTRYLALAALMSALACAGNKVRTDEAGAARDTTSTRDTLGGENQNPPGYRGMERDTSVAKPQEQTPTDTFLQRQGTGAPQDTSGYSGIERVDTTAGAATPRDTSTVGRDTSAVGHDTSAVGRDTSGMSGMDSTQMNQMPHDSAAAGGAIGLDSTGTPRTGDTTGYSPSQQPGDSTSR